MENRSKIKIRPLHHANFENVYLASTNDGKKHIVYKEFSNFNQLENRDGRCIFLIKSLFGTDIQIDEIVSELNKLYLDVLSRNEYEEIINHSRRAYPDYLLAD